MHHAIMFGDTFGFNQWRTVYQLACSRWTKFVSAYGPTRTKRIKPKMKGKK